MKVAPDISFLDNLESENIKSINTFFESQDQTKAKVFQVEAMQLAQKAKIDYSTAFVVLVFLRIHKLNEQKIVLYHNCDPFTPAGYRALSEGFPVMPWRCPLCDEDIEDEQELLYEFVFIFTESVKFPVDTLNN